MAPTSCVMLSCLSLLKRWISQKVSPRVRRSRRACRCAAASVLRARISS
jgi:hypothetical protein